MGIVDTTSHTHGTYDRSAHGPYRRGEAAEAADGALHAVPLEGRGMRRDAAACMGRWGDRLGQQHSQGKGAAQGGRIKGNSILDESSPTH